MSSSLLKIQLQVTESRSMMKKNYASLSQLLKELEQDPNIEIVSFSGFDLIVKKEGKKIRYGLCDEVVSERLIQ